MKRTKIIIIFLFILIIFILIYLKNKNCHGIYCLSVDHFSGLKLSEVYEDSGSSYRALYTTKNNEIIRLEVNSQVDNLSSEKLVTTKINHYQNIFENSISPYPGEISINFVCANQYQPNFYKFQNLSYYVGYLNSRLQFGSCSPDQIFYQGAVGFLYCPTSKKFFQIEYIIPINASEDKTPSIRTVFESIKCQ